MDERILLAIALIPVIGIAAQWLAWRIKLPSILLLLILGIVVGPIMGFINPDELLGDVLFPVISLAVAIILFEGGLSLRIKDLGNEVGKVVWRLILIGVPATWIITATMAHLLIGLDWPVALLLGSVLVVTGPTVIIPLLKQIRPSDRVSAILRWEGIIIDPIGAVLAVLVFEEIVAGGGNPGLSVAISGLLRTILIGGVGGFLIARMMVEVFARYIVPDNLQNSVALVTVLGAFAISNTLQPESGLLTVTIMGITIANQNRYDPHALMEFKENLQVLLLSGLFILLGARLDLQALLDLGIPTILLFVGVVIFIERPLSVGLATMGSGLKRRERLFISWMAPRGIVAASVSSVFAIELEEMHMEGAELLTPLAFAVIIGTVLTYSLTAGPLARALGLSQRNPQGVLIVGAHSWARRIAKALQNHGFAVLMTDTNATNVERAERLGLSAYNGNILSENTTDDLNLAGIGRLLALTSNDEVNTLAAVHFRDEFGRREVYQLAHDTVRQELAPANNAESKPNEQAISSRLGGQVVFGNDVTYDFLGQYFREGATISSIRINDPNSWREKQGHFVPLFVITDGGDLHLWTPNNPPVLRAGQTLLALTMPERGKGDTQETVNVKPVNVT